MKKHKWRDISSSKYEKIEKCVKCNIEKYWLGSDMQCWEYIDHQMPCGSTRTTLRRPECEPDRGRTHGFYKDGTYVK